MRWLERILGRKYGGSTGTNLFGALTLAEEMMVTGQQGSIVTLICDSGERYLGSYYEDDGLSGQGLDLAPYLGAIEAFAGGGME